MNDNDLLDLIKQQAKVLAEISAAHLALERVVYALIESHPDRPVLRARIDAQMEMDAVSDLYQPLHPELEQAGEKQRDRVMRVVRRICAT
jgi:hypothetical protein